MLKNLSNNYFRQIGSNFIMIPNLTNFLTGVRQQTLSRQTGRYGSCVHSWPPNMQATLERNNRTKRQQQSRERSNQTDSSSAGASSGLYGYSHLGCSKMCIQVRCFLIIHAYFKVSLLKVCFLKLLIRFSYCIQVRCWFYLPTLISMYDF